MSQVDYFLKLDGIEGEATADGHKGEIQLEAWSWGAVNAGSQHAGGGGGTGKVAMHDLNFVMRNCKASPKLMISCATGEHIKDGVLSCRKAGGKQEDYLKIKLTDVIVSSFLTGGSGSGSPAATPSPSAGSSSAGSSGSIVPLDQVSLNFAKIEWEYKEQDNKGGTKGAVKAGFCMKTLKKV
jgi:type VI secretion system secreted protein Hcp